MSEWHDFGAEAPPAFFDVLARYYDAGLNRFLIQRFCNCFVQDFQFIWPSPFGPRDSINLYEAGYRPIRWAGAPELPPELVELVSGPADHEGQS